MVLVSETAPPDVKRSAVREALPQILAVCVKNVLLLGFGMTLGFPTILIPSLSGNDPEERVKLGQEAISWIGSINLICVPVGCLMSGAITQPLGRKRAMQMVNIPFLLAWLLFHFSNEAWQIFVALCITGVTGGLLEAPVLTYVAEITQPHLRGILSSTSTMAVMVGVLSQFLLGTFLSWRIVVLINCSIPVISFILLILVPETPIWLISKSRFNDARQSLAWLRGWVAIEDIENEFQDICKEIGQTERNEPRNSVAINNSEIEAVVQRSRNTSKFNAIKLLVKRGFIWPYFIVALAFFLSHFNGNTTLQTYAIKIFSTLKTPIDKYYATVILGIAQLLGCIMSIIFVNIVGKRIINFISLLGSGICFFIVASYAYSNDIEYFDNFLTNVTETNITLISQSNNNSVPQELQWVPITFLVISAFISYLGIKILPWILTGEVYFTEIRATASGLSGAIGYIFGFLSNKIFLHLVSSFTLPGVFWFYGIVGFVGFVLLYFLLPETEGKSLFEITEHFAGRSKLGNRVGRKKNIGHLAGQSNKAFELEATYTNNGTTDKITASY